MNNYATLLNIDEQTLNSIVKELKDNENLWGELDYFKQYHTSISSNDDYKFIVLHYPDMRQLEGIVSVDPVEAMCYPAMNKLPNTTKLLFDLMRQFRVTRLGNVYLSKMKPGAVVRPHIDNKQQTDYYDHFQVCIQSGDKTYFNIEEESYNQHSGEFTLLDITKMHEVKNDSDIDRIVMVLDFKKPNEYKDYK